VKVPPPPPFLRHRGAARHTEEMLYNVIEEADGNSGNDKPFTIPA
jgi:hypothetical protein